MKCCFCAQLHTHPHTHLRALTQTHPHPHAHQDEHTWVDKKWSSVIICYTWESTFLKHMSAKLKGQCYAAVSALKASEARMSIKMLRRTHPIGGKAQRTKLDWTGRILAFPRFCCMEYFSWIASYAI